MSITLTLFSRRTSAEYKRILRLKGNAKLVCSGESAKHKIPSRAVTTIPVYCKAVYTVTASRNVSRGKCARKWLVVILVPHGFWRLQSSCKVSRGFVVPSENRNRREWSWKRFGATSVLQVWSWQSAPSINGRTKGSATVDA